MDENETSNELTEEEEQGVKDLALGQPEFLYYLVREILAVLPEGNNIIRRALQRWVQ